MAKRTTSFTLQKAAIVDAVMEGVMAYVEDRATQSTTGPLLDYVDISSTVFDDAEKEIDAYFNQLEEDLDNPDETSADLIQVSSEDADSFTVSVDLEVTENEDEVVEDLADDLAATAPVSASAQLLAVLNRLGLTVDKKNRILAIVGE